MRKLCFYFLFLFFSFLFFSFLKTTKTKQKMNKKKKQNKKQTKNRYCDYTASGRGLSFIEDYIRDEVLPFYANTHTTSSVTGLQTSLFCEEAKSVPFFFFLFSFFFSFFFFLFFSFLCFLNYN